MNITLDSIAYKIAEMIRGELGDDNTISLREIKDQIHSTRSLLLSQRLAKQHFYIDPQWCQVLPAQIMVTDDETGLRRTSSKIPQTISRSNNVGTYKRIGPTDRSNVRYNVVSHERALKSGNGRFNSSTIYAFELNEYIFLISGDDTTALAVTSIDIIAPFENPVQAAVFSDNAGDSLYFDSQTRYPISRKMENDIIKIVYNEYIRQSANTQTDVVNNSSENNEQESR